MGISSAGTEQCSYKAKVLGSSPRSPSCEGKHIKTLLMTII